MFIQFLKSWKKRKKLKQNNTQIRTYFIPDDFEIGSYCLIGKKTHLSNNIKIGNFTYVNSNYLDTFIESNTSIGNFCSIAPGVIIGMGNHYPEFATTHPILFDKYYSDILQIRKKKVIIEGLKDKDSITSIGSDVWIGARANIKRGVKVGNGAIIAAEAVVTKDVPDYAIVAGVPARVIGYRFDSDSVQFLCENEEKCFWNWNVAFIKENMDKLYSINDYKNIIMTLVN